MIVSSHPTGNAAVRHATEGLVEAGLLAEHWMCLSWNPRSPVARLLPKKLRHQLERRAMPESVRPFLRHHPGREMARMFAGRFGWAGLEDSPIGVYAVYRDLDRRVARRLRDSSGVRAVFNTEDGAAATFAVAREMGIATVYDLPIGYWRAAQQIYREEAERVPAWASTLTGIYDSEAKLAAKDLEMEMADVVIAASSFTRDTIKLATRCTAAIYVVPYGAPLPLEIETVQRARKSPLRALFVGSLGQRKGISYLIDAVEQLRDSVELTLIGRKAALDCPALDAAITRHRWIPTLPHFDILREMAQHDVLLFPSLFEGFGLVILEAMAQGLPVITTPQTAGPDLITEGSDGFVIPMRSSAAIVEKLDLLIRDRNLLSAMKVAARENAARHTWASYQQRLIRAISSVLPA